MGDAASSDFHILLICEAELDAEVVSTLADRALAAEAPEWIANNLDTYRQWTGIERGTRFTQQRFVRKTAKQQGLKVRFIGHAADGAKKRNAAAALKVLKMARQLQSEGRPVQAVVYQQDADSAPQTRRQGLAQARTGHDEDILLVTAEPNPKIEAWILHGFKAETAAEEAVLEALKDELKLDPISEPHRLRGRARSDQSTRDIKKILDRLTDDSRERQEHCWQETFLESLKAADGGTRLKDFLNQVEGPLLDRMSN